MIADVLHGLGIPDLNRARHRPLAVIGMRAVDLAVQQQRTIEMDDRPILGPFPLAYGLAGFLVILTDRLIIDRVEILVIYANALVGFRDDELTDLLQCRFCERNRRTAKKNG